MRLHLVLLLGGLVWQTPLLAGGQATIPQNAKAFLPLLIQEQASYWPTHPRPVTLAAQVEQETCVRLTSPRCWNPRTELKTPREYGFGLGQITITPRFDTFSEVKRLDPSLSDWGWADRYDPRLQLRALVLKDRQCYTFAEYAATPEDRLAFAYAAYNGGVGGVLSDRRVCSATPGCDENKWFGNVEHTSLKAKSAVKGYGQSFFQINRDYVRNILVVRPKKYVKFFKE